MPAISASSVGAVDHARQPLDDGVGHQILPRQFFERVALDRRRAFGGNELRVLQCQRHHVLARVRASSLM